VVTSDLPTPEANPDPTPVVCPAPAVAAEPGGELDALVARLTEPSPVVAAIAFPRGTLQPDGRVDLCKQALSPLDARRVIDAATRSAHARHLLLGTNSLGAPGIAALAGSLHEGHGLRTLYLGCNRVDAAGLAPLADRLATDRTVNALWLKRNPIGDAGVTALAAALATNPTIRTLDLTNTGMTLHGLRVLVAALRSRPVALQRLYLGGNGWTPQAGPLFAELVAGGLGELYLAAGALGDSGVAALAESLVNGRRLVLGLGGNGLTPAAVRVLAQRLPALSTLDLARPRSAVALRAESNLVGDEGATALAEALPRSALRRLDLRHTGVTGRGARLLVEAAADAELELLGLGHGVPRRLKRVAATTLRTPQPPAEDIAAIGSVYR
jgi:hypothetical protein